MVKIIIKIEAEEKDGDVSKEELEILSEEIAKVVDLAISGTKDPKLAMTILIKKLLELKSKLWYKYRNNGILK